MKLVKLQPADVWVGMALPFDIYDIHSILLFSRGHIIGNQEMLTRALERGMYAVADEFESRTK